MKKIKNHWFYYKNRRPITLTIYNLNSWCNVHTTEPLLLKTVEIVGFWQHHPKLLCLPPSNPELPFQTCLPIFYARYSQNFEPPKNSGPGTKGIPWTPLSTALQRWLQTRRSNDPLAVSLMSVIILPHFIVSYFYFLAVYLTSNNNSLNQFSSRFVVVIMFIFFC